MLELVLVVLFALNASWLAGVLLPRVTMDLRLRAVALVVGGVVGWAIFHAFGATLGSVVAAILVSSLVASAGASLARVAWLALVVALPARADPAPVRVTPDGKTLGVGVEVGAPTALCAQWVVDREIALEGGIGGLAAWGPSLSVHGDVVWHPLVFFADDRTTWSATLGVGALVAAARQDFAPALGSIAYTSSPVWAGARLPMGVAMAVHEVPLGLFVDVAPTLLMYPQVAFDLGGSAGMRVYL